ncbi:MAG: S8 family serine peptidase [Gemmatimonadota bacterium]|nr:MAG: S8 family serine peptidase [Gemmatimonadota bacterium]
MAVKISDDNLDWTEDILIKGLEFAADFGADVISMSWGTAFGISCQSGEYTETPDYARWRNVTSDLLIAEISLACAAGNDGEKLDCSGNNPIKYPLPYNISAPANCPPPWLHPDQTLIGGLGAVTAVGATDLNDNLYSSSSRGPAAWMQIIYSGYPYDIPPEYQDYPWGIGGIEGELIGLLKPDVTAPAGVQSTQLGGGYGSFSGTSAATPHVGGAMALLLSYNPNLTPAQLSQYLQMTSVELGDPGKDNEYGAGRIDACRAIIEAGAWQKGDVNADCDIDALDVTLVVNIILGYVDPTPYQFWTADCNDDEEINVLDVVCIINIINQSGGKSIAWNSDVVPAEVWFGQNTGLTLAKGSRCVLPINIRTKIPIAGIQMVFKLGPNALVPYELKTSSFTKDMKLRYSMKSDRLILVMYGEHGEAFGPGSGTAVEIVFDIDDITNIPQDPNFGLEFGDILLANTNAGIIPLKTRAEAEQNTALPETYTLSQNYPNPFNPETEISFQIPSATYTSLKVFNILGQEVKTLVDAHKEAGHYTITWSGRDESGKEVTSGVYFYTLKAGEFTDTKRMLLLK